MAWTERDIPDPSGLETDSWLATLDPGSSQVWHDDVLSALDAARGEPEVRPGRATEGR